MTNINDLRRTFFGGGIDEEISYLQSMGDRGLTAEDTVRAAAVAPKPLVSGRYYMAPNFGAVSSSNALGNGNLRLNPWMVPADLTLSRIAAEITVAGDSGSKYRLGIYDNVDSRPASLRLDAGTINGDSGTSQEITINLELEAGLYWVGGALQLVTVVQPTIRTNTLHGIIPHLDLGTVFPSLGSAAGGRIMSGVTGALPATFVDGGASGASPRILVKVA